jgi:hypothetical protein
VQAQNPRGRGAASEHAGREQPGVAELPELDVFDVFDVADVPAFLFVACASLQAIVPPSEIVATTLAAATARRARRARGGGLRRACSIGAHGRPSVWTDSTDPG